MSSSPIFTVRQKNDGEEEELLAMDQGRSHNSSPRSRPNSRLEILMMDLVRSKTEMARSQEERARSIDQKLEELARGYASDTANIMGRLSSVDKSLHGTPSPSPIPRQKSSFPSA